MTAEGEDEFPEGTAPPGDDVLSRVARFLGGIVEWAGRLTMVLVFAMVVLIATNVILRYFFAIGPVALQELEWHLLAPVAMFGCAYGMRHRSHVRVDIFHDKFSVRTRLLLDLAAAAGLLAASVLITWLSFNFVAQAYTIGEGSPDPGGLPHRFVLRAVIPAGFLLLALQSAAEIIITIKRLTGR
jgi:TRAP-type mannitol/chloroaromatic compound transport system permease small subunit